jgi:hypothetical protein
VVEDVAEDEMEKKVVKEERAEDVVAEEEVVMVERTADKVGQ